MNGVEVTETDKAASLEPASLLLTLHEHSDSSQASTDSAEATDDPDAQCSKTTLRGFDAMEAVVAGIDLADLTLTQKLVRALSIVQIGLHKAVQNMPEPKLTSFAKLYDPPFAQQSKDEFMQPKSPRFDPLLLDSEITFGQSMTPADYSLLIETLASALKEVAIMNSFNLANQDGQFPASSNRQKRNAQRHLGCHATLISPASMPVTPVRKNTQIDPVQPSKPLSFTDMPSMVLENLNSLCEMLKPIATNAVHKTAANVTCTNPAIVKQDVMTPALINKLPSETLFTIFATARRMVEAAPYDYSQSGPATRLDHMRWALSLSTVCTTWVKPGLMAGFSRTFIRSRPQLLAIVSYISCKPEIGSYITTVDIKVPAFEFQASTRDTTYTRDRHTRRLAFPWLSSSIRTPPASPLSHESDNGDLLGRLVTACTALNKFELNVAKSPSYIYSGWAYGPDFMEKGLQEALSQSTSLCKLTIKQTIDYGDLESILIGCSGLLHLRLEGGVDNLDGRDEVLEKSHQCKLSLVYINNYESNEIGEKQLCWILAPSRGFLRSLEVSTAVGMTVLNGVHNPLFPPFAGMDFADLLVELGPTLKRLALKDTFGNGLGMPVAQINATLRSAPHDGSLDYALSYCTHLEQLALEWTLTGLKFLESIQFAPLHTLALIGTPSSTSGSDFIAFIEEDTRQKLQKLTFVSFGGTQHWLARDVRALRNLCNRRNLIFEFTAV